MSTPSAPTGLIDENTPLFDTPPRTLNQVSTELTVEEIRSMIEQLSMTEQGESLREAMQDLKKALRANPEACALLLPEDIGQCVSYLRKLTGQVIAEQVATKRRKKPDMSAEALKALENDLGI